MTIQEFDCCNADDAKPKAFVQLATLAVSAIALVSMTLQQKNNLHFGNNYQLTAKSPTWTLILTHHWKSIANSQTG